ncbi:MAG: discoidin domain-containing protein [Armatimonadota bacterium]|nr:discoidin domain-containing protein [Armatimonadota bacterium]
MRTLAIGVAAIVVASSAAAQQVKIETWRVQATGPVTLTMQASGEVGAVWARDAAGTWHRLEVERRDGRLAMSLGPEQISGGSALVVIDPPQWLEMDDAQPPEVVRFTVGGRSYADQSQAALGWTEELPGRVMLAVRDEKNPLDPASMTVTAQGRTLRPGDAGVSFAAHDERSGTLKVLPREIEGLADSIRGAIEMVVDDFAIDDQRTRRSVSWTLAPSMTLEDGTVITVDSLTSDEGWSDWSVIADGEIMTEEDTTTAGKTWLSDEREDAHWLRFELPEPRLVNGVDLWWPYYQVWRTSRSYQVQTRQDGRWVTQVTVEGQEEKQHSEHRFEPVETTAVRILQSPMGGQAERQNLMWLAEAQVSFAP